jgi:ferredoxin-thioredoxin reductase catalytic subunit
MQNSDKKQNIKNYKKQFAERKKTVKIPSELTNNILEFARVNNLTINPFGLVYYAESYQMFKHCACDKDRITCPCGDLALSDITRSGRCLCGLYYKDIETFMKMQGWMDEK